ncbi:MAG TPA: HAD-IC family P-type ATPase, partial [Solirubrobacteraceae bacterium]|nr:HAD-IC family P-type ATPase [Solirubrobacteraceae bacterium]
MSGRAHVAGLSGAEARRRLARDGPNVLPAPPRPGIGGRLAAQLRSPLIGLLGVAAALALALGHALDAAVILVVVVANAVLDVWQGVRADRAAHALRELLRPRAVAERDGRRVEVEVAEIVVGDVVVLDAGDRVPADGRILEARNLELDESLVTGESLPVERADGELLAGTTVVRGLARMAVARTGAATRLGAIVAAATEARPATPLERQLGRFAALLLRAAGALCLALTATAWAYGGSLGESLLTGVALAVAAIPEGLPAVVSITLALGVRQLAQRGAIVRAPHAVETLGCTTTICADKTGTLTENRMEVARVADLSGAEIGLPVASLPPAVADLLLAAALASETSLLDDAGPETVEATDAAVLRAAVAAGARDRARREGVVVLAVEPFDSGRRYAAALVGRPGGPRT